jgi:hypothetical protein
MKFGCLAYQLANNQLQDLDYLLTEDNELRNRGN